MPATPSESTQKAGTFIRPRRPLLEVVLLLGVFVSLALAVASGWYYFYGVPKPPPKTNIKELIQEARVAAAARQDAANKIEAKPFQPPPLFPPRPQGPEVKARHILIKDKESFAKELAAKLKADPSAFAELAREHSKDKSNAQKGGDLGWFGKGRMVKSFDAAAFGATLGEIVGPVKSEFGYHIIQVTGRREPGRPPEIWPEPKPAPKKPKQTETAPAKEPEKKAPQKPAKTTDEQ